MNRIINITKLALNWITALFPTQVPIGVTAFNSWADSIVELSGLPNNDSVRFALATTVMHLGPTGAYKPRLYFALVLRAGAAKQIAAQVFQDIKTKQMEESKKAAEATAPQLAVVDGSKQ